MFMFSISRVRVCLQREGSSFLELLVIDILKLARPLASLGCNL